MAGRVLLRNVTLAAEGVYKCEISTEAPYFDTDYREANLSIIGTGARESSPGSSCPAAGPGDQFRGTGPF